MFLSGYGMAAREIRQAAEQRDQLLKAQETAEPPTPGHSAAEAANEYARDTAEAAEAARRRQRIQHEVDPYCHEAPEVAHADLGKTGRPVPDSPEGYPKFRPVNPEAFRRGPVHGDHAAASAAYQVPTRPVPVPSVNLAAGAISRPPLTDGRARPHAPGAAG